MKQFLLFIFFSISSLVAIAQPSISPVKAQFDVTEPKVFSYTGGTGSDKDWIGVYPLDTVPDGTPPSLTWQYITSPSGTLSLNGDNQAAPLTAGTYAVHLFCCDGYNILASSTFVVVGEAPASMGITSYPFFGDSVGFNYDGGTGSPQDWIGIYLKDEDPNVATAITYEYVNGIKKGSKKLKGDDLIVNTEYDAHLLCCNGYNSIVKTTFKVYDQLPPNMQKQGEFPVGGPITFAHQGGTGSLRDWVGIYDQGAVPGTVGSLTYLYVDGPNGTVTFDSIPELEQGKFYDAHFLCCDEYDIIASVLGFQVGSSSTADLEKNTFKAAGAVNGAVLFFDEAPAGKVDFFNAMGQNVKSINVTGDKVVNVDNLASGIMLVKYSSEKSEQTSKIVVR